MKTKLTKLHNANKNCEMTEPVSGRQPVLALLMRLLLAAVLALSVFGAQAGVVFTSLYSFTGTNDGANPVAGLVQGNDGNLYGTTPCGGSNGYGTVFKISTSGVLTNLWSFTGGNGGAYPQAGLVQGSDGNFYGTTAGFFNFYGYTSGHGTVFKISTNGALTSLYSFGSVQDTNGIALDGANPNGLVQGSDGSFYGTTQGGGTYWYGTVFKISTNGVLTSLYSFGYYYSNGYLPAAGLVQGSDGNFYGTTDDGGTNGYYGNFGTVFRISTSGELTTLYEFDTVTAVYGYNYNLDGANPQAAMVQGSDGYFYGTTSGGGSGNDGTVFKISTNGALTSLWTFYTKLVGIYPNGLVQGSDGNFFGTTEYDGSGRSFEGEPEVGGNGTVFEISTNGVFTTLYWFDTNNGTNGSNSQAGLVQGSDGSFYGTTEFGGTHGYGTVFKLTIVPEPHLTIIPFGSYVILTWPTNAFVFTLQSTTNLGSSAIWNTNSLAPIVIGGQNVVVNPITGSQMFYRLHLAP
jgi:uncharacterized repeat protein (TIGR03803 family)